jgi:hypothetical protein
MLIINEACFGVIEALNGDRGQSSFTKNGSGTESDISVSPDKIKGALNNFAGYNKDTFPTSSTLINNYAVNDVAGMAEAARADLRLIYGQLQNRPAEEEQDHVA